MRPNILWRLCVLLYVFSWITTIQVAFDTNGVLRIQRIERAGAEEKKAGGKSGLFTAYNPTKEQTEGNPHVMASGKKVYKGALACPEYFELGTKIRIEGLGVHTCEDRMAPQHRDDNKFDIMMMDKAKADKFGEKRLRYEIVK